MKKCSNTNQIVCVGNISSIETMGMHDGPGVRVVIFMQGCALRCLYCHNPETWNMQETKQQYTPQELVQKILRYQPYFQHNGGVTFSGGEPLLQAEFVYECVKRLKKHNVHVALDTAGVGTLHEPLLALCDLIILDVKASEETLYKTITGQKSMQPFLQFVSKVQELNKPLWIRQVIVPKVNNSKHNIEHLAQFVNTLHNVQKVELLGYHTLGVDKYKQQNISYPLQGTPSLEEKEKQALQLYLQALLKNKKSAY